jgi:MFS family permease
MSIGIFLVAMDGTIVLSTYAAIGSELNQLQNTSWIATGYLLTMTSFQSVWNSFRDLVHTEFQSKTFVWEAERYFRAQVLSAFRVLNFCVGVFVLCACSQYERTDSRSCICWSRWWGHDDVSLLITVSARPCSTETTRMVSIIMSEIVPLRSRGTWQGSSLR